MSNSTLRVQWGAKPYVLKCRHALFVYYGPNQKIGTGSGTHLPGIYNLAAGVGIYSYSGGAASLGYSSASFDYYISPTADPANDPGGTGTNDGSSAHPWSIYALNSTAARLLYPGHRVGLMDGVYPLYTALMTNAPVGGQPTGHPYVYFNIQGSADPASPTVISAVNTRRAILDAHQIIGQTGTGYAQSGWVIMGQDNTGTNAPSQVGNTQIIGLIITGAASDAGQLFGAGGIDFTPVSNVTQTGGAPGMLVQDCEIYDFVVNKQYNCGAIKIHHVAGCIIRNNRLHDVYNDSMGPSNAGGIFAEAYTDSSVYEYNTIFLVNQCIFEKNAPIGNSTTRYNYLENTFNNGFSNGLWDFTGGIAGSTDNIYNNILVGTVAQDPSVVWGLYGSSISNAAAGPPGSLNFFNNTLYSTSTRFTSGALWNPQGTLQTPTSQFSCYNNLFIATGQTNLGVNRWINTTIGSGCIGAMDYNYYVSTNSNTSTQLFTTIPAGSNQGTTKTNYTFSQWNAIGNDQHSGFQLPTTSGFAPTDFFISPGVSLNPNGYKLKAGSPAANFGHIGGVSGGTVTDAGAWGGANAPTRIGCDFAANASLFLGNSMQGMTLQVFNNLPPNSNWLKFVGTDTKYGNTLPVYPASPWGGTATFTDSIQQIYNAVGDITEAIVTDSTVPAGVSTSVLQSTLVNPYVSANATQDVYLILPSTSVAQGMLYTSRWVWLQADITSRGPCFMEICEFKTPDPNFERFQLNIEMQSWTGFGATTPVFELRHDENAGAAFNTYVQTLMGPTTVNTNANSGWGQTYPVPVPLGRWFRIEWAFNRVDSSNQGWMWAAITDPGSSDPVLQKGITVFAARGPVSHVDTSNTWTNGLNATQPTNKINRLFLHGCAYSDMSRNSGSTYVVKMTDMQVYAGWPSGATGHPAWYL